MKVKLKIPKKPKMTPKIDVRNRFSALMGERENEENIENPIERINSKLNYLQEAINAAQEKVLPKKKREAKQAWITEERLQKIEGKEKIQRHSHIHQA